LNVHKEDDMSPVKTTTKSTTSKAVSGKAVTRKKATTRKAPARKRTTPAAAAGKAPTPEERYRAIEERAYLLAERNGFQGDPLGYWLDAEREMGL
jgi:hypothetical protein